MIRRFAAEGLGSALLPRSLSVRESWASASQRAISRSRFLPILLPPARDYFVLIAVFAPVSGAHFNPAVTLALSLERSIEPSEAITYISAQIAGAFAGVLAAHVMFGLPLLQMGVHERATFGEWLGEAIATFGLVLTVRMLSRSAKNEVAAAVALWITAAYWFTSSTSFANPAVTMARSLTDTFAGIAPVNIPAFIAAQLVGAALAVLVARRLG